MIKKSHSKNNHCGHHVKENKFWWCVNFLLLKWFGFLNMFTTEQPPKTQTNRPKVAFIGGYGSHCGVSTYNEELIEELNRYSDVKVFAEFLYESESSSNDPWWVKRCWDREDFPKRQLIKEVCDFDPDIIHISHEYGFFKKAFYFTNLVSTFKLRGYIVIATLHSVYDHLDKTVTENCLDHIITHTIEGKNTLIKKGIDKDKISVVPHGLKTNGTLLPPLWDTWQNEHTVFHPGFLFKYKGHMMMLEALNSLKEKYPNIHYIIQGSENPRTRTEHDNYVNELINYIKQNQLETYVTLNRGFVDKSVIMSHIRTTSVVVLPYTPHPDHDVYATSGIARMVLTTQTPLITSKAHLFDDIASITLRVSDADDLHKKIDQVFSSDKVRKSQSRYRLDFLADNKWSVVARKVSIVYKNVLYK